MTQSRSAEAVPPEAMAAQRTTGLSLAMRNWRVARQLVVLVAIPAVLILVFTGLWVTDATRSADAYGQAGRLAALGQQVTGLAQAMADERSDTATYISSGRPAAGLAALHRQYAITDAWAARVRGLIPQLGSGYPAQTRAETAQVLASVAKLPGLRRQAAQSQASALAVITGYSAATSGLFPVIDGIADPSGNSSLAISVRALGSLSRMIDHASQQQAILGVALAQGSFGPGALTALITAQAQQASDLATFRGSANPEESWALTRTLAGVPATQAQAVEQRAIAAGNGALAFGPQASQQWSSGMSYTVGWMGHADQELAAWITADAQAMQRSAMRSAIVTGAAGLAALALVLLGGVFAARSMVRRLRRLEAAAPERALTPLPSSERVALPSSPGAVPAGFAWRNHLLLERLLQLIDNSELNEDDPERLASLFEMDHLATRIWRNSDSALVLTGHETPRPAEPLTLVDVLRAATSEIEEYGRVTLDVQQGVRVSARAGTDTVHLLAELLENAAMFSPDTAQVIVSGHAVWGGGALVTITDGGTGMSEEELTALNQQLATPSPDDMAVAQHMGLYAVALLAARHGITVTLGMPPDGGTTAEVYLPDALISLDAEPDGWQRRPGEEADAEVADLPFFGLQYASGPEALPGPEADAPEEAPLMAAAPVPSLPPGTSADVTEPGPVGAETDDTPPIFESVRSGYPHAFGREPLRSGEQGAGQSPAELPARPPARWGNGNGRAAAAPPAAGEPASSGLPQRVPEPGQVPSSAADKETGQASAAEEAEIARAKLANFQRGSRWARAVAGLDRDEKQPEQDG